MAGFRSWTDADRLGSDDLNGYLMGQVLARFANAADRDAQMGGVVPGQVCYLADPGALQIAGPAGVWANLPGPFGAVVTLVAGVATVSCPAVTATSRIQLTAQTLGTVTTPSALAVSDRTAGVSFTITASQPADTSVVAWQLT